VFAPSTNDVLDLRHILGNRGLRRNCRTFSSLDVVCIVKSGRSKDDGRAAEETGSSNWSFFRKRNGGDNSGSIGRHLGVMVMCESFIFKEERRWAGNKGSSMLV
jgi:hypothetical protein